MKPHTLNRLSLIIGIVGVLAFIGAGLLLMESKKPNLLLPVANAKDHDKEDHGKADHGKEDHGKEDHGKVNHIKEDHHKAESLRAGPAMEEKTGGHEHGAEGSDLDRPVEELWAAKCEHDMLQYECDECRYEVGVVKLPDEMIAGKAEGGFIRTARASHMEFSEERVLSGELGISEEKTFTVTSPLAGAVKAVYVMAGKRVETGAPLFDIDSHEVSEGKAAFIKALATLDLARKTSDRESRLFEKKISAQMEVEEAKARLAEAEVEVAKAGSRLVRWGIGPDVVNKLTRGGADFSGLVTVRAPGGGVVMEKHTVVGEFVEVGKNILRISDISEVWAWANLKEADLSAMQNIKGAVMADVALPGGKKQRGKLDLVSKTMDEKTRTVRARITLPNPDGDLRPGMFVEIKLLIPGRGKEVAVPKASVFIDEGRSFVFTHKERDFWIRRPVVTGREIGGQLEVLAGLSVDQTILTDGAFVAKSDVLRAKMGAGCAD
jgi:cobalt-zinc-cadmium efflux system membrane fusion protein